MTHERLGADDSHVVAPHERYDDVAMYLINEKKQKLVRIDLGADYGDAADSLIVAAKELLREIQKAEKDELPVRIEIDAKRLFSSNEPNPEYLSEIFSTIGRYRDSIALANHEQADGLREIEESAREVIALAEILRLIWVLRTFVLDWDEIDFDNPEGVSRTMTLLLDALSGAGVSAVSETSDSPHEGISGISFGAWAQEGMQEMFDELESPRQDSLSRIAEIAERIRVAAFREQEGDMAAGKPS
ncbi:MAG: hypothetical protein HGA33_00115 [Candidatus Moranbacteria bacterium]|nr:hypothetical protein [Candidatus Moranbacteria bacterium]